jgi:undecaprenyl-diphosphatase
MSWLETIVLAVVQGLTEFLPVSSSGHLALAQHFFGISSAEGLPYDIVLHLATALAAVAFYRRDVAALVRALLPPWRGASPATAAARRVLLLLAVASVPTGLIGFALKDRIEALFDSPRAVAAGLVLTGALLVAASRLRPGTLDLDRASPGKAAFVGLLQGVAVAPGVSRSGSTVAAALFAGLRREDAVRFSFLLSVPAICGAALLKARHLAHAADVALGRTLAGFIVAGLVGYLSIFLVLRWTRAGRLWYFGAWCWAVAAVTFAVAG